MKRVVALGFFDGVHLGHGALLRRAVERAGALDAVPAACTFDPHPAAVITHQDMPLLTTPEDRAALMEELYGIREVRVVAFDEHMMTMPWADFVSGFLIKELNACHLVAGSDYRFGYQGEGTAEKLQGLCRELGLGCDIIDEVRLDGERVSSTRIRKLVEAGEMDGACRLLGHPYLLQGEVAHGKGLGSRLGFPTANLSVDPRRLLPAYGVYAGQMRLGRERFPCAANIGVRPTVRDGGGVSVEAFLLDFDGDLYGKKARLELFHRLRGERAFGSLEALRCQVQADARAARAYFGQRDGGV